METLLTIKIPSDTLLFSAFAEGLLLGMVSYNGIVSTGLFAWQAIINDILMHAMILLLKNILPKWFNEITNNHLCPEINLRQ
jgi:hypothetical protein